MIGDMMLALVTPKMLAAGAKNAFFDPEHPAAVAAMEKGSRWIHHQCANNKGYIKSLHSTIRYFPLVKLEDDYIAVGKWRSVRTAVPGRLQ
jgi:hypothetical protein